MTKNVTVTDEHGNYIGVTYPKRAKGLIKNGRALFVDDCTIRLSGKTEPSDTYNQSEVKQMNYIYFNPRNWSFEQTQYSNNNGFGGTGHFSGRPANFAQPAHAERSFISDFDGGLVECLMFGDWDTSYVRALSNALSLTPDTDYQFVFWLNGGENDKSSEICKLQIAFGNDWENCYTYKLNRNYIKPLLHKDGWELYSIPFCTPRSSDPVTQPAANTATIGVCLSFVAGNAPMAVKPAKEPKFYANWVDAPDEFADRRPQRHNLIFADGWPNINQYGGNKYSTEALRSEEELKNSGNATRHTMNVPLDLNIPPIPDIPPIPAAPNTSTLSDDLAEHLDDIEMQRDDLSDRADDLNNRFKELLSRIENMTAQGILTGNTLDSVTARISAFQSELQCLENRVSELDNQVDGADLEIEMLGMSDDEGDAYLDSLESMLDAEDGHADGMENSLDSLEEYLDTIEDVAEKD